ncbi:helix-turn-helix transcriptional regulator [bacterium]|nr:helix-turn-helix transcriptional regulator [bacterium]
MGHVGKFILRTLKQEKKSLRWLARESGVSNSYLSQLTRGLFKPSPEVLIKLAPPLGVEPRKMFEEAGWLKPKTAKKARAKRK